MVIIFAVMIEIKVAYELTSKPGKKPKTIYSTTVLYVPKLVHEFPKTYEMRPPTHFLSDSAVVVD